MNPEVAKEWVEALRSDKYKQDVGSLRTREGYCCLGVLCDLATKHGIGKWENSAIYDDETDTDTDVVNENEFAFLGAAEVLPDEVRDWAGLNDDSGGFNLDGEEVNLTNFNDGYIRYANNVTGIKVPPSDFKHIADIIESNTSEL